MKVQELTITISGLHGVGKSVYSKALSKRFGLTLHSAGEQFRKKAKDLGLSLDELSSLALRDEKIDLKIDEDATREASKGGVVVDGLLSGWMLNDKAHIKILLTAPLGERIQRIAERDGKSIEEAKRETLTREKIELERFKKIYGIDLNDLSIYNLILDTSLASIRSNTQVLVDLIDGYLKFHQSCVSDRKRKKRSQE